MNETSFKLKIKLKFTFNPMEFKLPMANDLVVFINPFLGALKHPLTVKVS